MKQKNTGNVIDVGKFTPGDKVTSQSIEQRRGEKQYEKQ